MCVLVSYDVSTKTVEGRRRLNQVAKLCVDHGQRVQFSVFECILDPAQWARFRQGLLDIVNLKEDSLRFYFLGRNWKNRVEHHGAKPALDIEEGPLIF